MHSLDFALMHIGHDKDRFMEILLEFTRSHLIVETINRERSLNTQGLIRTEGGAGGRGNRLNSRDKGTQHKGGVHLEEFRNAMVKGYDLDRGYCNHGIAKLSGSTEFKHY